MKPEKMTLYDLFTRPQRYAVPLFQRPYVWTNEKQWSPLWEDVLERTERALRDDPTAAVRPHFLGAIVISEIKVTAKQIRAFSVIDGQQRLTTFQILLIALRDYERTQLDSSRLPELERLTENQGRMEEDFERYKVWPTNDDRADFEIVANAGGIAGLLERFPPQALRRKRTVKLPQPRLVEAYCFFYNAIAKFVEMIDEEDNDTAEDRLEALYVTMRERLELVAIQLEADDDPTTVFESLNHRGVPLQASDLVRNFVFSQAVTEKVDVEALYARWWRETFEKDDFWKLEIRQGRLKRPRLDVFLFAYLVCKSASDLQVAHVYQELKDWWQSKAGPSDVESGLRDLTAYAVTARRILSGNPGSDRVGLFARRMQVMDTSTVLPVALFILREVTHVLGEPVALGMLAELESFLVRRYVGAYVNKAYNRLFAGLLANLRLELTEGTLAADSLRRELLRSSGESQVWPGDEAVGEAWRSLDAYNRLGSAGVRMILEGIDLQLTTGYQETLHLSGSLSVEHVLPIGWRETWSLPPASMATATVTAAQRRDRELHRFGNLTLVTGSFNTKLSNRPYAEKRPAITLQSALRLNTYFQDVNQWNEDEIARRGETLLEVFKRVWSYPPVPGAKG